MLNCGSGRFRPLTTATLTVSCSRLYKGEEKKMRIYLKQIKPRDSYNRLLKTLNRQILRRCCKGSRCSSRVVVAMDLRQVPFPCTLPKTSTSKRGHNRISITWCIWSQSTKLRHNLPALTTTGTEKLFKYNFTQSLPNSTKSHITNSDSSGTVNSCSVKVIPVSCLWKSLSSIGLFTNSSLFFCRWSFFSRLQATWFPLVSHL